MSETDLGGALEFLQEPQDVEVYRDGDWVLGSMIGWRREEGSSCRIMVRLTEKGAGKTAWAALPDVRLPEDGAFPRTQSLPFLPRLPQGWTEPATTRPGEERSGPLNVVAPLGHSPSESTSEGIPARHASSMHPNRHAEDARTSWLPSWDGPTDDAEAEPTRLLTLRRPRQR